MPLVHSDGRVYWSRTGTLDVLCRFSGLAMFPYDLLSCPIELGGWIAGGETQGSGKQQGISQRFVHGHHSMCESYKWLGLPQSTQSL